MHLRAMRLDGPERPGVVSTFTGVTVSPRRERRLRQRQYQGPTGTKMKVFHCGHCDQLVFFENTICVRCQPWEDWAETWAHYLHMDDTIETAAACGLSLRPARRHEPSLPQFAQASTDVDGTFDQRLDRWFPITYILNHLNRGIGLPDGYPFVLSTEAIEKLRFVHETVSSREWRMAATDPRSATALI